MRNVLWISLVVMVILAGGLPPTGRSTKADSAPQRPSSVDLGPWRYDLIPAWQRAVARHNPGEMDQAATDIAEWPMPDLNTVVGQVKMMAKLLVASRPNALKTPIRVLLGLTNEEVREGNANRLLKRGALLHTDIAVLAPDVPVVMPGEASRYLVRDGRLIGRKVDPHWELARLLLDSIDPHPSLDEMVLLWYRATAADMQNRLQWGTADEHLGRARKIFPSDPRILFYSGTVHESFAGAFAQNTRLVAPPGSRLEIGPRESELKKAQGFFREAIAAEHEFPEAHLRLGRVTGLLGNHSDAVAALGEAATTTSDPQLRYYVGLFLGYEHEMLGNYDAAREQFQRAATLYPTAQSPLLALCHLMRWTDDFPRALASAEQVLNEPSWSSPPEDPWWIYYVAQVRDADELMGDMRQSIGGLPR